MSTESYAFGPFVLLPAQRTLLSNGQAVRLGGRGMDLLLALVERAGEVVSKEDLIHRVWPRTVVDEGGLRVHIAGLRKVLGEARSGTRYIGNVPSRGYCFLAPVVRTLEGAARVPSSLSSATQLPSLLTRLIGREEAIAAAIATLPKRRFLTLVGPGGIGKTTVALAAAGQLECHYQDGACFVDFSGLTDPAHIVTTVTTVLGVPTHSEHPLENLAAWLAPRRMLIVLDNCEHVIAEAARLAEALLAAAPSCHLLATSREPLRAQGEWVQRLPALPAPPEEQELSYADALRFAAFELFVERAEASFDGTALSEVDVPQLAHLCRKLDGIPLAIELVAAQIGFFGLSGLLSMLEDQLTLTMLGRRTALPRHQTLRSTLDWSYELLSKAEQRLLRRLAVFSERFTIKSAMTIAGERAMDTAQLLMSLVSKSLVCADPGEEEVFYKLLETTRSYATEKLQASDEYQDVLHRHANYCLAAVQQATLEFEGRIPERWRERHCRRIDDVRAALRWCFSEKGDPELGGRLAADAAALYFGLWLVPEYIQVLERAFQALPPDSLNEQLDMQLSLEFGQACLAMRGGAIEGLNALTKSATIAQRLEEHGYQLSALWGCFSSYLLRGDYQAALVTTEAFGRVAQESVDTRAGYAFHRMMALCLHFVGEQPAALAHARASLHPASVTIGQLHGNTYQLDHRTASLTQLARVLWLQGYSDQSLRAARDAIDAANAADHALSLTYTLAYAACPIALWAGDDELAERYIEELQDCADAHSLVFWQSWPKLFQEALRSRKAGDARSTESRVPMHFSQVDMMATLHHSFVGNEVAHRARSGLNKWCTPEVLRVLAERELSCDRLRRASALPLLMEATEMAEKQGANAWFLRCAITFSRFFDDVRPDETAGFLERALLGIEEEQSSADARVARARLEALSARLVAPG